MEGKRELVIVVDDSLTNLSAARTSLVDKYDVLTAPSGEKLFSLLGRVLPDMILLDINMPVMDGYEVIGRLKKDRRFSDIPVIFLTAKTDRESELKGLSMGAIDYIVKPFSSVLLLKRVEIHMLVESQKHELQYLNSNLQELVEEKIKSILELQNALLHTMAELVECRDNSTGEHIERTQRFLELMLESMQREGVYGEEIATWDISLVLQSAQLHDVGKIAIPDSILLKAGRLSNKEFEIIKEHTIFGEQIISKVEKITSEHMFLSYAKTFAVTHHEKWDGSGYPYGLKEMEIPLMGRVMAIVDVYDALISDRVYKSAFPHAEAVKTIKEESGKHFDPKLVEVFLRNEKLFEKNGYSE